MNLTCIFFGIIFTIVGFMFACGKGHIHLSSWKNMPQEEKEKIFSLVKGKKTPLSFQFVMMLKPDLVSNILAKYNLAIREDEVAGLFINILYDRQGLKCTAGVSRKTFVLDKTLEEAWDQEVKERFLEFL